MDVITLAKAKKYAQALINTLGEEVGELDEAVKGLGDDVEDATNDILIVNQDGDVASKLIINRLRQHIWENEQDALVCEEGTKTLTNTKRFPFNDSKASVSLAKTQKNTRYVIIAEVSSVAGNIGDIVVSDKLTNGFKLAFTGGARSVTVKYYVIGGFLK